MDDEKKGTGLCNGETMFLKNVFLRISSIHVPISKAKIPQ